MMWVLSGHALEKGFALGSLSPWLFALARQSWLGVTVFLVLSGFLVAHVFAGLLEKRMSRKFACPLQLSLRHCTQRASRPA